MDADTDGLHATIRRLRPTCAQPKTSAIICARRLAAAFEEIRRLHGRVTGNVDQPAEPRAHGRRYGMPMSPDIFRDAPARFDRFKDLFDALDVLGDEGTTVRLVTRGDMDWILSRFMMAALGKVLKTLQATQRLCVLGYGEDAALLLRANINLLINLTYIAGDTDPNERARDLQAYTHTETMKWYAAAAESSGKESRGPASPFESEELEMRARRWSSVRIRDRATRTHRVHYDVGYRFYSSLEHSDIFGLGGYFDDEDDVSVNINSQSSDSYVSLVLRHTFAVVADILECIWRFLRADSSGAEERIRIASQRIYPQPPQS